jgi:hypothetical protein
MATEVKRCTNSKCTSTFQDGKYGKRNRVHNRINKEGARNRWRCTVCKQERE